MTKTLMPQIRCWSSGKEDCRILIDAMERHRVQATNTATVKKRDPRGGVLDKKMKRVKLKEHIVVSCKPMH
jgi:hypothetical protein